VASCALVSATKRRDTLLFDTARSRLPAGRGSRARRYFRVVTPGTPGGAPQALVATVSQLSGSALDPKITVYDQNGQLLTGNLTTYLLPTAADLPTFETDRTETPTPHNPMGVKGIGEGGTTGSTPAVANAVLDALRPLGIRHLDMPLTPFRIWEAIKKGGK